MQGMPFTLSPKPEPNITTRMTASNSIKKKKNNANTICTYETFSKYLFIMHIPKKNVYKILLCIHSRVENLYKNTRIYCVYTVQ